MVDNRQIGPENIDFISYNDEGQPCLCAQGAIFYALTGELPLTYLEYCDKDDAEWPHEVIEKAGYNQFDSDCPDYVFMNDYQGLSFEEIAARLEAEGY